MSNFIGRLWKKLVCSEVQLFSIIIKCTSLLRVNEAYRGGRYLMGENLKVVWAEFSILS